MFFKRRGLKSSRKVKEARRSYTLRTTLIVSIFLSLIVVLSLASHLPEMTITSIDVRGSGLVSEKNLQSHARTYLEFKYFGIFSKANIFIYPQRVVLNSFLDTYPEIKNVTIKRTGLQSIVVLVEEYKPFALWCVSDESCYFLTVGGVIFAPSPIFDDGVFLKIESPILGERVRKGVAYAEPLGSNVFRDDLFSRIMAFLDVFSARGIDVIKLIHTEDGDTTIVLRNGVELYFTTIQNLGIVLDNLESVLATDELDIEELIKSHPSLEYVDLRFSGRVFVK